MNNILWRTVAWALFLALATPVLADDAVHIGVASCAGDNCHGAVKPLPNSHIPQTEYLIWRNQDKHANAYAVLTTDRSKRIAVNLHMADDMEHAHPETAALCLDCHADNAAADKRGPGFQISDGVGCEACHGGAGVAPNKQGWLGAHLSGLGHKANIEAGLYPTDQPLARGERCLSCHVGDDKKFVTHRIMGSGHPPMPFELDTYTAKEPAHFVVNASYIERKGKPNDMQIWAVGQAVDVKLRMDLILDGNHAPKGLTPELSLFDCQSCHHSINSLQYRPRTSTGLPPGSVKLYDATALMLKVAATRVAPDAAKALSDHILALHKATQQDWKAVTNEAAVVRDAANTLIDALTKHDFDKADAVAMADAVIGSALGPGGDLDYSGAQQQVMALKSIVAALKQLGFADDKQLAGLTQALKTLDDAIGDDQKYRPDAYADALKAFKARLTL